MPSSLLCKFYLDFSPTYVGCGLICTHLVNCSVFLGAIISWGFLWPFVCEHAGNWYPVDLGSNDFKGLYGYKMHLISYLIGIAIRQDASQYERISFDIVGIDILTIEVRYEHLNVEAEA
ncbi:putative metal-nicotianamine transporter YSL6 [Glycine soja]|uniref:Putative metal-nicotianamine transporter YSL6 n=1 Tax=Glycine soja TaxID=3848 RepID=A0A445KLQ3_GLYSO|nr:putative metal-nicotianamine transporter YSL6 [Glycine soja]